MKFSINKNITFIRYITNGFSFALLAKDLLNSTHLLSSSSKSWRGIDLLPVYFSPNFCCFSSVWQQLGEHTLIWRRKTPHLSSCLQLWVSQSMHCQLFSSPWELLTKHKLYLNQNCEATFSLASFMPSCPWANHLNLGCGEQMKINCTIHNFKQPFTISSNRGLPEFLSIVSLKQALLLRLHRSIKKGLQFPFSPLSVHCLHSFTHCLIIVISLFPLQSPAPS